ncbi:hypothetical protein V8E54_004698 [Elaphomyces granulatus]
MMLLKIRIMQSIHFQKSHSKENFLSPVYHTKMRNTRIIAFIAITIAGVAAAPPPPPPPKPTPTVPFCGDYALPYCCSPTDNSIDNCWALGDLNSNSNYNCNGSVICCEFPDCGPDIVLFTSDIYVTDRIYGYLVLELNGQLIHEVDDKLPKYKSPKKHISNNPSSTYHFWCNLDTIQNSLSKEKLLPPVYQESKMRSTQIITFIAIAIAGVAAAPPPPLMYRVSG